MISSVSQGSQILTPLATVTGIDGKATGTTNLYTVPAGKTAVITAIVVRVTAADTVAVPPTLGAGVAAGEIDIMPATPLTGLVTTGLCFRYDVELVAVMVAAGGIVKLGIDTGATATTLTLSVDIFGYLV